MSIYAVIKNDSWLFMITVQCEKVINASVETLLYRLLNHTTLNELFNASFKVVKSENKGEIPGGTGCIRQVKVFGIRFFEQITHADHDAIHYRVLDNFPVCNHRGEIRFNPQPNGTSVHYTIECEAPWFVPKCILTQILDHDVDQCLLKLKAAYDPN